jgi:hypothetical protein
MRRKEEEKKMGNDEDEDELYGWDGWNIGHPEEGCWGWEVGIPTTNGKR